MSIRRIVHGRWVSEIEDDSIEPSPREKAARLTAATRGIDRAEREEAILLIKSEGYAVRWSEASGARYHYSVREWDEAVAAERGSRPMENPEPREPGNVGPGGAR